MKPSKRALLVVGALAAFLPFAQTAGAAVVAPTVPVAGGGTVTGIDWAINAAVQKRVVAQSLSPAAALVAREQMQMQFKSLSAAQQQKILAALQNVNSDEGVDAAVRALNNAVQDEARQALAEAQANLHAQQATGQVQGLKPKLGVGTADKVFVSTTGPCRVFDSRFGPGQLAAFAARQIYAFSDNPFYLWSFDQGGTGQAGVGNCAGTVFPGAVTPVAVVATVTVVNTVSAGALQAWDGGTTLSGGAVVNWSGFDRDSNTTVIPMNRFIASFPGSGSKRDIAVNNNSFTPIDVVIDVVGYFIDNLATALECQLVIGPGFSLPAGTSTLFSTPACPAGFTSVVGLPVTNQFGVDAGTVLDTSCRISNYLGVAANVNCDVQCCRIPGR